MYIWKACWFEHSLLQLTLCLTSEGAKNFSWPSLSLLRGGWGSLTSLRTLASKTQNPDVT